MVKFRSDEISLLELCLKKQKNNSINLKDINFMSIEQYNTLRELVCDELVENGFSYNSEINEYGKKLEELIDKLGELFM